MTNIHESGKILEKELSYKIVGSLYTVTKKYGKGLKEVIYQNALIEEFERCRLEFEPQKRIVIYSIDSGKPLGCYVPDFVIGDKVILEIKSLIILPMAAIRQQRSYLKASEYEIAYLVNFGSRELEIIRSIHTNDRKSFIAKLRKHQISEDL